MAGPARVGGTECRCDKKRPGRPPRLNQEQQNAMEADIDKSPQKSGWPRPKSKMLRIEWTPSGRLERARQTAAQASWLRIGKFIIQIVVTQAMNKEPGKPTARKGNPDRARSKNNPGGKRNDPKTDWLEYWIVKLTAPVKFWRLPPDDPLRFSHETSHCVQDATKTNTPVAIDCCGRAPPLYRRHQHCSPCTWTADVAVPPVIVKPRLQASHP